MAKNEKETVIGSETVECTASPCVCPICRAFEDTRDLQLNEEIHRLRKVIEYYRHDAHEGRQLVIRAELNMSDENLEKLHDWAHKPQDCN